ncbi:MAG: hypothetical protein WDN04_20360 [Rhodospirillales bacterium]
MRAAIYWAPGRADPLWKLGLRVAGARCESGVAVVPPDVPNIVELTSTARLYGFHCTLRSPMRLGRRAR